MHTKNFPTGPESDLTAARFSKKRIIQEFAPAPMQKKTSLALRHSAVHTHVRKYPFCTYSACRSLPPALSVPFFSMLLLTSRSGSSVAAISGSSHIQCCCRANILVVFICCCCCCYPSRDYYYCGACVAKEWRAHTTAEILFAFKFTSVPFFRRRKNLQNGGKETVFGTGYTLLCHALDSPSVLNCMRSLSLMLSIYF